MQTTTTTAPQSVVLLLFSRSPLTDFDHNMYSKSPTSTFRGEWGALRGWRGRCLPLSAASAAIHSAPGGSSLRHSHCRSILPRGLWARQRVGHMVTEQSIRFLITPVALGRSAGQLPDVSFNSRLSPRIESATETSLRNSSLFWYAPGSFSSPDFGK